MTYTEARVMAEELKCLIHVRLRIAYSQLQCPREKSDMTPCVARDGSLAVASGVSYVCVGCGEDIIKLLEEERNKHAN